MTSRFRKTVKSFSLLISASNRGRSTADDDRPAGSEPTGEESRPSGRWGRRRRYFKPREKRGTESATDVVHRLSLKGAVGLVGRSIAQDGEDDDTRRLNDLLLQHFAEASYSSEHEGRVDFAYVRELLDSGADINVRDVYGQTLLHEVARAWHVDLASWISTHGANVNNADNFGRTPLHLAASADCPEMVKFLIKNGADIEALTYGELHTPVFFAAKYDSRKALEELISAGGEYKMIRDYKGRTPIHVAAESARGESVRFLLDVNTPVGVSDYQGEKAVTWIFLNMSHLANEVLNKFCITNRRYRRQYYYFNLLETDPNIDPDGICQSPHHVATDNRHFQIIMHPVMMKLLQIKWRQYARFWALCRLVGSFLHVQLWTWTSLTENIIDKEVHHSAEHHSADVDSAILWILVFLCTIFDIGTNVANRFATIRRQKMFMEKRAESIRRDMQFCHPRWPEEKFYLESELSLLRDRNVLNWGCYVLLLMCVCTRIIVIVTIPHSQQLLWAHIRLMCFALVIVWVRLMKDLQAFDVIGSFVTLFPQLLIDALCFILIYLLFFLPFLASFWIIYGGTKRNINRPQETVNVSGFEYPTELFFSMLRITLVDDYDYENMKKVSGQFTDVMLMSWVLLSGVLLVNVFIALLSETFRRVYDNARANAIMQKAITVHNIWEKLPKRQQKAFHKYIHRQCSPLDVPEQARDDSVAMDDMNEMTFLINEKLDSVMWFMRRLERKSLARSDRPEDEAGRGGEKDENMESSMISTLKNLREEFQGLCQTYTHDIASLQRVLQELLKAVKPDPEEESLSPSSSP